VTASSVSADTHVLRHCDLNDLSRTASNGRRIEVVIAALQPVNTCRQMSPTSVTDTKNVGDTDTTSRRIVGRRFDGRPITASVM